MSVYQRNPLAAQLLQAHEVNNKLREENQRLRDRLTESRQTIRGLRADKIRLQARIADLKKYRPQAPHDAEPRDEAEARLRAATNEITQFHKQRRTSNQGYGRKKVA